MDKSLFDYTLPQALIARYPPERRRDSRLLVVSGASGAHAHRRFPELLDYLSPGDLLVFNDTRVIPARLYGHKASGGRVELMLERLIGEGEAWAQLRASKPPKPGARLALEEGVAVEVVERSGAWYRLRFELEEPLGAFLERAGHMPLPPYLERTDERLDRERYQTVYARRAGAVAAPTAGLHFDDGLLQALEAHGVERAHVTLHVGAGTFQPVRTERVEDHHMHAEYLEVPASVCEAIERCRARGGRVVAVGTTTVRALETAARGGALKPFHGDTEIFIYPGFEFQAVDALVTNFHLPASSLLMMVCAFGGYDSVMSAYREAIEQRYRFYSYGDAMLVFRANEPA